MKKLLYILFFILSIPLFSKEIIIGTHTFVLEKSFYNQYSDKGITLMIYRSKADTKTLLHSFTLENQSGGCSEKSIESGTFKIKEDKIIFYSHWARSGRAYDSPSGDRKQVYRVDSNGNFIQVSGQVYIEKSKRGKEVYEGMKYLYTPIKTKEEQQALVAYTDSVEKHFHAKFVYGAKKEALADEVNKALREKSKQRWQ